jgi:hypothetical protein
MRVYFLRPMKLRRGAMMPTKRLVVRVPDDVKAWLEQQAIYYGGTLGSEVSKSCRQRMEREASTDRRTTAAAE